MHNVKAIPGQVVEVGPLREELKEAQLVTLIKTADVEVLQLAVPSGSAVPSHQFPGEVIVHCLQGRVSLSAAGATYDLRAGQLLYYALDEPFTVWGVENASLLITLSLPREGIPSELIG